VEAPIITLPEQRNNPERDDVLAKTLFVVSVKKGDHLRTPCANDSDSSMV
jgi:hypothetical protein